MNLLLLFKDDFINDAGRVRLEGRRFRHVLDVHRPSAGDELRVGLAGGLVGTGRITSIKETSLEMDVNLLNAPPAALPLTLILALPRPKVLRRILLSVTAMGVKHIILINSFRVEKSFWQSPVLQPENIQKQLILGLEQARDTILPEVLLKPFFKPFAEDEIPSLIKDTLPLIADPGANEPCPRDVRQPVTLAIGPEGGFIQYEIDKLISLGFNAIHLGDRILNIETVVPSLISRIF
ncbi:MAG: 16S rRNA (uracil(1498)-N(3))-methyltransferase [Nitrospirae bacterium GWC2_42_7]|nr:MAG: 16S rRNA (uracil(1498)-N(3))-methyltransferase [Nitrospirae bacterium GWC2_42_7]